MVRRVEDTEVALNDTERWVSEYDYDARTITLTRAIANDHHWATISRYDPLCDAAGDFSVYISANEAESKSISARIVKLVATMGDDGDLRAWHPDFDLDLIGSLTIWPFGVVPDEPDLKHWIWWSRGNITLRDPRPWIEASQDSEGQNESVAGHLDQSTRRVQRRG
jgi:hypothetical protein